MGDPIEEDRKQESLDRLRTEVSSMLNDGEETFVDFQLSDISTQDVHNYLKTVSINQDLPQKLLKIDHVSVSDIEIYDALCDYSQVYNVPFNPLLQQRVYFIETADNALTVIPIQLAPDSVNINIELLENSPKFIKDMYMKMGKLKMEDIKFVKLNK